jgi:uncharacterized protein (TIGR03083 family)
MRRMSDVVGVLDEESRRVAALLRGLQENDFALPTRCRPWDVKDLAAHLYRSLLRIPTVLDAEPPESADTDSVTYWRSYDVPTDAPVIEAHARETASEYPSGHYLARAFDELVRDAVARARRADPGRLIRVWWGPTLRLDEFLKTRVLEVVVHGLDMTHALGRDPIASDEGLQMVRVTLEGLIGGPAPARWSDVELIEKGTGRAALDDGDAQELGAAAESFPLLG